MENFDFSPLFISLKTGAAAAFISFFLGVWLAWRLMERSSRLKCFLDSILTLPLVLPPTAAGFILLLVFGTRRPVGGFLYDKFDIRIVQSFAGLVIAAFVIAFPLMYRNARAAFEQIDRELIYAARTLGMSELTILLRVCMPAAAPGLISGAALTFARAVGEYGATSMIAGNIPFKTATVSQRIAMVVQDGDYFSAGVWVAVTAVIFLIVIVVINILPGRFVRK